MTSGSIEGLRGGHDETGQQLQISFQPHSAACVQV